MSSNPEPVAERSSLVDAVELIVDGCVEACREFDRETLEAVANAEEHRDRWVGLLARDILDAWDKIGERP